MRRWDLVELRVWVEPSGPRPVVCELRDLRQGRDDPLWTRHYWASDFGISDHLGDASLRMPIDLRRAVAQALTERFAGRALLWLHLLAPYGQLAAVPWEREIISAARTPVVRLPEPLPAAAAPAVLWRLGVILNAPAGAFWPTSYLPRLTEALTRAVKMPIEVHAFCDAATAEALSQNTPTPGLRIHRPPMVTSEGPTADRWRNWLCERLADQGLRALYIAGDGRCEGDRPRIAVAIDPALPYEPGHCGYLTGGDIRRLADRLGAPAVGIGSTPGNPCELANRLLADEVGVGQCGPTAYVDVAADSWGRGLAAAQAFLANPPGSTPLPIDAGLFAYVQPTLLESVLAEPWPRTSTSVDPSLTAQLSPGFLLEQEYVERGEEVPGWVASSARYLDYTLVDQNRFGGTGGQALAKSAFAQGRARARSFIQDLLVEHADKKEPTGPNSAASQP